MLEFYWNQYHEAKSLDEGRESSLPFDSAYVPSQRFHDNSLEYFNLQRLGGVQSHLEKEYSGRSLLHVKRDARDVLSMISADLKRARSLANSSGSTTSSFLARAFSDPSSRHDEMCK